MQFMRTRFRVPLLVLFLLATLVTPPVERTANAWDVVVGSYSRVGVNSLRMRTGPSYNHSIVMTMPKGAVVRVVAGKYNGGWYKVSYRGKTGYSIGEYLTNVGLAGRTIAKSYYGVIVVSLARQQLEAYQGGSLVFVSAITTGQPALATPTGTYKIVTKLSPYKFVSPWPPGSPYYYESAWTKYAMRFRWDGFYIHDAPWRPYYGYGTNVRHLDPDGVYRTGSHGCINMPMWSMTRLYNWAPTGTVLRIVSY